MPFSMSRMVFVGQSAWSITSIAANGPPAMQLLKKKQQRMNNNQGMGNGEEG